MKSHGLVIGNLKIILIFLSKFYVGGESMEKILNDLVDKYFGNMRFTLNKKVFM
jgi:hypothetical protein